MQVKRTISNTKAKLQAKLQFGFPLINSGYVDDISLKTKVGLTETHFICASKSIAFASFLSGTA